MENLKRLIETTSFNIGIITGAVNTVTIKLGLNRIANFDNSNLQPKSFSTELLIDSACILAPIIIGILLNKYLVNEFDEPGKNTKFALGFVTELIAVFTLQTIF